MKHIVEPQLDMLAQRVLATAGCMSLPIDVECVASHVGIDEIRASEIEVDASIERLGTSLVVTLNSNHAETRRRFSLAHEIGHVLLGHLGSEMGRVEYRGAVPGLRPGLATDEEESLCNTLAGLLLLPTPLVLPRVQSSFDMIQVVSVARAAQVSLAATLRRVVRLSTSPVVAFTCHSSKWFPRKLSWVGCSASVSLALARRELRDPALVDYLIDQPKHRIDGDAVNWIRSSSVSRMHAGSKYEFVLCHIETR